MAGDWIKMQGSLASGDPAVMCMARTIEADQKLIDRFELGGMNPVTRRDVCVTLCVTALLRIWSLVRNSGRRIGDSDDVFLRPCTLDLLDDCAQVPGFGAAMREVGWAIEGPGDKDVTFPSFLCTNELRVTNAKSGRERTKEWRDRVTKRDEAVTKRDVTSKTSVTACDGRGEERREEKKVKQKTAFAASDVLIPEHLEVPEVRQSLDDWLAYKKARKQGYASPDSVARLFNKFKTPGDFVDAIDHAIACNYQGVFAPKQTAKPADQPVCQMLTEEEMKTWSPYG